GHHTEEGGARRLAGEREADGLRQVDQIERELAGKLPAGTLELALRPGVERGEPRDQPVEARTEGGRRQLAQRGRVVARRVLEVEGRLRRHRGQRGRRSAVSSRSDSATRAWSGRRLPACPRPGGDRRTGSARPSRRPPGRRAPTRVAPGSSPSPRAETPPRGRRRPTSLRDAWTAASGPPRGSGGCERTPGADTRAPRSRGPA